VHAHDGAYVSGQVAAAGRARQVLRWVQPVSVNHEVSESRIIVLVTEKKLNGPAVSALRRAIAEVNQRWSVMR
jgi:hypothetical protein